MIKSDKVKLMSLISGMTKAKLDCYTSTFKIKEYIMVRPFIITHPSRH